MGNEKFERQDFVNGLALAGVLLFLLMLILLGAWSCSSSLRSVSQGEKKVAETTTTAVPEAEPEEEVEEVAPAKEPGDVIVRVGNGANKSGLATSGTRLLSQNGYNMLRGQTKQGQTVETSNVYFTEGFEADAFLIADVLAISSQQVQPLPEDPGVDVDTADVVVILGEDADF